MSCSRVMRYCAYGCLFLLWVGAGLADTNAESSSPQIPDECAAADDCVDQYLWSLYARTPKVDTIKVTEQRKTTVTRKGKTRTVMTTVSRLVDEDFAWKDLKAAEKAGLSLMAYVIGGMDQSFKRTLYHAFRAMDDAGLAPGITSAFRDDYRQSLASGNKARIDRSFHGGSSRGGYGHGLAVDLVSVRGATRAERCRSSEELWSWIDAHGKDFGIARPYLDWDAPHVAPIDGQEYADHHGVAIARQAAARKTKLRNLARHEPRRSPHPGMPGHPRLAMSAKPDAAHVKARRPAVSAKVRGRQIHHTRASIQART